MSRFRALPLLIALVMLAPACHGPGHVEFTQGQCVIDGRPAKLAEVEQRQSHLSERILARQPLTVLVTVLIVVLAGFSHIEKLLLLFSTRHTHVRGLAERLRVALERYRVNPVRYFSIVVGTLLLLGMAGGFYVYLDADKRASERALGLLQFCHLALRNNESEGILAEQRRNLEKIESTAGSIRSLVDKLPPEEQRKAKEVVSQINLALTQQGKLVGQYAAQTEESTKAVREQTENLQKGLTTLGSQVLGLKLLPASLRDLSDQVHALDGRLSTAIGATDAKLAAADAKLGAIKSLLETLAARPELKSSTEGAAATAPKEKPKERETPPAAPVAAAPAVVKTTISPSATKPPMPPNEATTSNK
jgi:hypothetical protein